MNKKIIGILAIFIIAFSNIVIAIEKSDVNTMNDVNIAIQSENNEGSENDDSSKVLSEENNIIIEENNNEKNSNEESSIETKGIDEEKTKKTQTKVINNTEQHTKVLENGEYEIHTSIDSTKVFDIDGGSINSGAKLQIWDDCNVQQQRFILEYCGDGEYKISVKKSKKILDVENASTKDGTNIQQYDNNNTVAQRWYIDKNSDGTYSIISKCNNLYITVPNGNYKDGQKLLVHKKSNEDSQKFTFTQIKTETGTQSIEDGEYEIRTAINDNRILDITGGSTQSEAKLQIWDDCNVTQQRFYIEYIGEGYYKITARHSSKVLDVEWGGLGEGTRVQQYDSNGTDAQKWIIKENEDGTFYIISKLSNLYLTLENENSTCGTKVLTYEHKENDTYQKFIFDKVLKDKGTQSIEDGEYEIRTAIDNNQIFDITGGSTETGAELQIWNDCNVTQQRFYVKYTGNGYYKITVRKSGKVLDVPGASITEKTKIQQYDSNGTDAQKWIIKENEDNTYSIISKCNGLYITVPNSNTENGTDLLMYENKNNDISQRFIFEKIYEETGKQTIKDGTYEIRTAINDDMIFDITGGSTETGAKLQIWQDADVSQQRFNVKYIGDGLYSITVKKSSKVLDIVNGVMENGNKVQQYDWNNTNAQKWIIKKNKNGTYSIISKGTGLYLTTESENISNGTKIITYGANGKASQEFIFEEVTEKNGIDVSSYQNDIDWKAVKESGIDFAFIRLGYRGFGTGRIVYDTKFEQNIKSALENGIKCGVYFYSQAINENEAIEEADFVIEAIKKYNITYPIVIDSEYATAGKIGRADNLSKEDRTNVCNAFCKRIKDRGYTPMIYASKYWLKNNLDMSKLSSYQIWLAHYVTGAPSIKTDYAGTYRIWQYTSSGQVNGISGNVDLDIIFKE